MKDKPESSESEMRAEYNFTGGVRGKYANSLREKGYTIRVFNDDGTFGDTHVLGEKTVVIAPDVWEYFSSADAVNNALRTLIALTRDKAVPVVRETSAAVDYTQHDRTAE